MTVYDNPTTVANKYNMDRRTIKRLIDFWIIQKKTIQKGIKLGKQLEWKAVLLVPDNIEEYFYKKDLSKFKIPEIKNPNPIPE